MWKLENWKLGTEPKTKFSSSYTEEENESPDLSQSDKSSDSSNESASFKWESLTQYLESGQQAITAPRTKIRIRKKMEWQFEMKFRQLSVLGSQGLRTTVPTKVQWTIAIWSLIALGPWVPRSSGWTVQTRVQWTMQSCFILTCLTNSIGRAANIDLVNLWISCWPVSRWPMSCWNPMFDITLTSGLGSIFEQMPISYGPWGMPLRIAHKAYQIARGLPMGICPWVTEDFPWRSSTDSSGWLRKSQTHPSLTW